MMITILSQIYHNTKLNSMILTTVALVLFTAMLMSSALEYSYHVANAQSFTKRSSTNCEGDVCHTQHVSTTTAIHQFQIQLNY